MVVLKPWYKVDCLVPREDLREGKPLDASEFAVHLDQVRDRRAPADYQDPERFFNRTYLTKYLTDLAAQVVRRLSGEKLGTNPVFNLSTQFGGGKTHGLTLLYHLANNGPKADRWTGVKKILDQAEVPSVPEAAIAVFVGTEFDSLTGRGGDDGTPRRKTPWGEIAFQLGGEEAFNIVAQHEQEFTEPKGDVIRKFLPKDKPCLILMDEVINYVSTYRKKGYNNSLYNFIQSLSETARGLDNVVLVVSIPASELEYTPEDEADEQRFKKMLDRVGKPVIVSAESETSEIIRRRLFEWNAEAVTQEGKVILNHDAEKTCNDYADWVMTHRASLPQWFSADSAREAFRSTYPFHPTLLSVFERKWQVLPRFQRTRGVLRLLALWVSKAYQEGFRGAHRDPLIGLGSAPLDDPMFRAAIFEQLGTDKLEGAITTDICGTNNSHAIRLDKEAVDAIKKARLHRKIATTIFFESNGGQSNTEATVPEVRLAVGEPELEVANVETVVDGLRSECYYLLVNQTKYRFGIYPNLNKMLADRRANIAPNKIDERIRSDIQKVFPTGQGVQVVYFPEAPNNIPNQPAVTLAVLSTDNSTQNGIVIPLIESMIREAGTAMRTFKSALIFAYIDSDAQLREEARKLLAWEDIRDQESRLDNEQKRELAENLKKAERDLKECVWRAYKNVALLGKDNTTRSIDLGLITSSAAKNMVELILNRLRQDGELEESIHPRFLIRNWSPAFTEWSTKSVRDAFFASPLFPRLLSPEAVKEAIARGVRDGVFAYVGKSTLDRYDPFEFKSNLSPSDVEISEDIFLIKGEEAELYLKKITEPPTLAEILVVPSRTTVAPGKKQTFTVEGRDQYGQEIPVGDVTWTATGGVISADGTFEAGEDEGNFIVTAAVGSIQGRASLGIVAERVPTTEADGTATVAPPEVVEPKGLSWKGEIPPQKWTQFYTKVLTKFATDKTLTMKLKVEIEVEGDVSEQKRNETRVALQELGLSDGLE